MNKIKITYEENNSNGNLKMHGSISALGMAYLVYQLTEIGRREIGEAFDGMLALIKKE